MAADPESKGVVGHWYDGDSKVGRFYEMHRIVDAIDRWAETQLHGSANVAMHSRPGALSVYLGSFEQGSRERSD